MKKLKNDQPAGTEIKIVIRVNLLDPHHFLFVPEAGEAQSQVQHCGGVERTARKLQRLLGVRNGKKQTLHTKYYRKLTFLPPALPKNHITINYV